jgi:hypothetical protein
MAYESQWRQPGMKYLCNAETHEAIISAKEMKEENNESYDSRKIMSK